VVGLFTAFIAIQMAISAFWLSGAVRKMKQDKGISPHFAGY